jgi:hypothetical protein
MENEKLMEKYQKICHTNEYIMCCYLKLLRKNIGLNEKILYWGDLFHRIQSK